MKTNGSVPVSASVAGSVAHALDVGAYTDDAAVLPLHQPGYPVLAQDLNARTFGCLAQGAFFEQPLPENQPGKD